MNWYLKCISKFADFSGRASRSEFWYFVLIHNLIAMGGLFLGAILHEALMSLAFLYALVMVLPSIAVGARRLHDTGRSGWFQLVQLIPAVGGIILLVFFVQESSFGRNEYGSNPKNPSVA